MVVTSVQQNAIVPEERTGVLLVFVKFIIFFFQIFSEVKFDERKLK